MKQRVLFIAYNFPPVGGAGVQRTIKFVKYLPRCGWEASVLTVANPSVPTYDQSFDGEIPLNTIVRRAKTWEPSYAVKGAVSGASCDGTGPIGVVKRTLKTACRRLATSVLQPDPQVLWMPAALEAGERLLREMPHAAIVATAPPFSALLIGAALSRRTGVPLVLDYRDEWNLSSAYWENKRLGPISRSLQERLQQSAIRAANSLVATTNSSAAALDKLRGAARSSARVDCIYNGYDPDDYRQSEASPNTGDAGRPYRLTYVGTLWNLTSAAPIVGAMRSLFAQSPALRSSVSITFAGRRTGEQQECLEQLKALGCQIVEYPYLEHNEALELLRAADGLCLLLSDLPGLERVVPAKLFEYMAARKPILSVGPRGEVWDLLRQYPAAHSYLPGDTRGIATALGDEIRRKRAGRSIEFNGWDGSLFDRRRQTEQLAGILDSLS